MIKFFSPNGYVLPDDPDISPVGYLPYFLDAANPESAAMQINRNYAHGGGWNPFKGFRYTRKALYYAGDPPMRLIAFAYLRYEVLRFYEGSWLAIEQQDGSVEIGRVD